MKRHPEGTRFLRVKGSLENPNTHKPLVVGSNPSAASLFLPLF